MPHPEREHELQIALATALRERDEAHTTTEKWLRVIEQLRENLNATLLERDTWKAQAEKWAMREAAGVERGIRADADALSEIQGLQAAVERLRGDLVKYGSHVNECNGDDFCSCGLEVARLAAARAALTGGGDRG